MRMNKRRLDPDKPEVLVIGPDSALGSGCTLMLDRVTLFRKDQVCNLGVLLDLALLLLDDK